MGRLPETLVARLACDEPGARRLADALAEMLDPDGAAVSAHEVGRGAWNVELHFVLPPDRDSVRRLVADIAGEAAAAAVTFTAISAKDWVAISLAELRPVPAGRFVVHGAHDRGHVPPSRIAIEIEAALAFGTGHHGTTRGCLLALDALAKRRKPIPRRRPASGARRLGPTPDVLDVGTGTGILAIAAAQALRRRVRASDIDMTSIAVARDNARANRSAGLIEFIHADGLGDRRIGAGAAYAVVLANILLPPLRRMAAAMARLVAPGGHVVLSGLLDEQAGAALAAYRIQGLRLKRRLSLEGWTTLVLVRPRAKEERRPGRAAGTP